MHHVPPLAHLTHRHGGVALGDEALKVTTRELLGHGNPGFMALHDFNAIVGLPIIAVGDDRFLLFHFNALADALYESPFYWIAADKDNAEIMLKHRGLYTEAFALQRMTKVFGSGRVFQGVNIDRGKGERLGEIDVLVLFGGPRRRQRCPAR